MITSMISISSVFSFVESKKIWISENIKKQHVFRIHFFLVQSILFSASDFCPTWIHRASSVTEIILSVKKFIKFFFCLHFIDVFSFSLLCLHHFEKTSYNINFPLIQEIFLNEHNRWSRGQPGFHYNQNLC